MFESGEVDFFDKLEGLLCSDNPNFAQFIVALKASQSRLTGLTLARSQGLLRLAIVLQQFQEGRAGTADLAVLFRQVIRAYYRSLRLKRHYLDQLSDRYYSSDLRITSEESDHIVTLVADDWHPKEGWLDYAAEIDRLSLRRTDPATVGDGQLYGMTGYSSYQSEAQKIAVQIAFFAQSGSTILVTLPTGAGKSLVSLLPAWRTSRGGRRKAGTTLVVVPTVSLALDQEAKALQNFLETDNAEFRPASWTGGTSPDKRATIRNGLTNGTLPLLFVSPEALMNSELREICLKATKRGYINYLVVDEAHLVASWGAGFRTEFQFLGSFRRRLLAESSGKLRTVLLSATVSEESDELLQNLSSESVSPVKAASLLNPAFSRSSRHCLACSGWVTYKMAGRGRW